MKEAGIYNKPTSGFKLQSFVKIEPVKVGLQSRSSRSSYYSGSITECEKQFYTTRRTISNPHRNEV